VTFSIVDGAAVDILTSDPSKEAVLKHARGAGSAHTLVERTDDVARPAQVAEVSFHCLGCRKLQNFQIFEFWGITF
jgi:hypothetical protein